MYSDIVGDLFSQIHKILFERLVISVIILAWSVLSCPNTLNLLAVLVARDDEAIRLT